MKVDIRPSETMTIEMVLKYSDDSEDLKGFEESSDEDEMETLTDLEEEEIRYFCLVGQEATGRITTERIYSLDGGFVTSWA